jgi:hypothetical protein
MPSDGVQFDVLILPLMRQGLGLVDQVKLNVDQAENTSGQLQQAKGD